MSSDEGRLDDHAREANDDEFRGSRPPVRRSRERVVSVLLLLVSLSQIVLAVRAFGRGDPSTGLLAVLLAILFLILGIRHTFRYWLRAGAGAPARGRVSGRLGRRADSPHDRRGSGSAGSAR